jgi:hypothetical protein
MHTPGPWTAEGEIVFAPDEDTCAYTRAGKLRVCTIHVTDGTRDTLDANARLIAAAPKLLEALERFMVVLDRQGTQELQHFFEEMLALGPVTRDAIAEAKS